MGAKGEEYLTVVLVDSESEFRMPFRWVLDADSSISVQSQVGLPKKLALRLFFRSCQGLPPLMPVGSSSNNYLLNIVLSLGD